MDPQRFDTLTRHLSRAGSRRRVLTALVAGALGRVLGLPRVDHVAAACGTFDLPCDISSPCCENVGLRCRDGHCRCQKGWKHCLAGGICQNLNTDPDHCGDCANACPPAKPCCIKGKCREMCGDTCCADCFVEVLINGQPDLAHPVCCESSGGTICEHKKAGAGDDRCCYPTQVCVKGKCCCNGCEGAVECGGKCCAIAACCNGKCCAKGDVCATKEDGAEETCVPANRNCVGDDECFPGETCNGGTCCSGLRICGAGNDVCCKAGERCEFQGQPNAACCPINTICNSTYRGHRVRR